MSETKKVNRITMDKTWKLGQWIHSIHERLQQENPSYVQVAEWATKELGFTVTDDQISSVAEIVGVTWPKKLKHPGRGSVDYRTRLVNLEQQLSTMDTTQQKLGSELSILRGVIHSIMEQLGVKELAGYRLPKPDKPAVITTNPLSNPPSNF